MRRLLLLLLLTVSGTVYAAPQCQLPPQFQRHYDQDMRADQVCLNQPVTVPTDYFMLAVSWSPGFCEGKQLNNGRFPDRLRYQCENNQFAWVVHGLWAQSSNPATCRTPDGKSIPQHPRYCKGDLPQLPLEQIKPYMCMSPGEQLLQGEWEKHGACDFASADEYFRTAQRLYQQLQFPRNNEMRNAEFFRWMKQNNPSLNGKRLERRRNEVFICYSKNWQVIDCPAQH